MTFRTLTYILLGAVVLGSVISFVPTTAAQQSQTLAVKIPPTDQKVKPLQGIISITGSYDATITNDGNSQVAGIPVTIKVTKAPAWASAVASPATDILTFAAGTGLAGTSQTFSNRPFSIAVSATQDAPAFTPDTIEVTVTTNPSAPGTPKSATATVQITADYFGQLDVNVPETIKIVRPQETVSFPVKVSNFGNGNTKVTFTVTDHSPNLVVQQPVPVTLLSKQTGGTVTAQDVQLSMQTPYHNGYLNEVGSASYKITSAYVLDPKLTGDSSAVTLVVTTKGFYVPGFEPLIGIGLVGALAIVMRRVRST